MSEQKQPKVRFSGFDDDWEQCTLKDVSARITRKNSNLESNLPLTISAQDGLVDQNTFFGKTIASKDTTGYFLLKKGEFAYNKSYSKGYPFGAVKRLDKYDEGVLSTLYIVFAPRHISSTFLAVYYDSKSWYKEIYRNAAEGARNHGLLNISSSDFFDSKLTIPSDKNEQRFIGRFIKTIDKLIAANQRQLEELKTIKKLAMQKIFDQEWRFNGFTDAWEQHKLGEVFSERLDRTSTGELISVTINNGVVKSDSLNRKDNSSQNKSNYKKVNRNDIAYNSMRMWQGASGVSQYEGILSPAYTVLIPNQVSSVFFSFYFKKEHMKQTFQKYSQGLTSDTWNLKYPQLKLIHVLVPAIKEQNKIANLLSKLDSRIAANQSKSEQLKKLKKWFMQNMFM